MNQNISHRPRFRTVARNSCAALAFLCSVSSAAAWAQETLLVEPSLPDDFDRGRNTSVLQRERPDYDRIGIRAGSFNVFPQVAVGLGYSDNLYYSQENTIKSAFTQITPAIEVNSDWSRHGLKLRGSTDLQRYFAEPARNQTSWDLGALGTIEVGSAFRFFPELQIARDFETPFTGETTGRNAALSNYLRKYAGLRGEYSAGQTKLTLAVNDTNYQFSEIQQLSGTSIDQSNRDRNILLGTAQVQYAFTPSVAAYAQLGYADTNYDTELSPGVRNRDSDGYSVIGGFNFDFSGLMRGTIGMGYTRRDFRSPNFNNVSGFSFEGKLEYFPSELTTVTLAARRVIEDSSLGSTNAFFDNRASLRVDHELLQNLILSLGGEFERQNYVDSPITIDTYRVTGSSLIFANNWLSFNANISYTGRSTNGSLPGLGFDEFRGLLGVTFKR
ncbi:MAG TPA: outer membrane beta-barrel protein [Sphingobium sp.]|uniref:outer membrane beta-barrel protein n=1 Tax=Sphingobium sp. TaxID=1912891 RepID=UPI002ED3382E